MTREQAKEILPIFKAFAEGKTIQILNEGKWCDLYDTDFKSPINKYRIKPEPKYRPFKNQEECWEEMHKHPDFGWLYYKDKGYYANISAIGDRVGMSGQKFAEAYNSYTFTDNEPFGIKGE